MTASIDELHSQISREIREANLPSGKPTEVDILHRRLQIAFVGAVVVVGLLITTFANDLWSNVRDTAWIDPQVARFALLGFSAWIAFYLWDKDRHLKKVSRLSDEIERLDQDVAGNLLRSALVLESVESVHTSLRLDEVGSRAVDQARWLVGGTRSSLHLVDEEGQLLAAEMHTDGQDEIAAPDGMLALIGDKHSTVQLVTADGSMLCAPLRTMSGTLLGILTVTTGTRDHFGEESRLLLERFAMSVRVALQNARRYEAAVFLLDVPT